MGIKGQITGIKYNILLADDLKQIDINKFNINDSPACFIEIGYFMLILF